MLRRESSGPASWSSLRELESDDRRSKRAFCTLAPRFKQSDLDPPTGGCSNQCVRVGQSPALHGFRGHAYVTLYLIHPMKDILTDLYIYIVIIHYDAKV